MPDPYQAHLRAAADLQTTYDLDPNFSPSQLAELYGVSRQRVWALAKLYNVQLKGMNRAKRT